jgi:hypothetical protein
MLAPWVCCADGSDEHLHHAERQQQTAHFVPPAQCSDAQYFTLRDRLQDEVCRLSLEPGESDPAQGTAIDTAHPCGDTAARPTPPNEPPTPPRPGEIAHAVDQGFDASAADVTVRSRCRGRLTGGVRWSVRLRDPGLEPPLSEFRTSNFTHFPWWPLHVVSCLPLVATCGIDPQFHCGHEVPNGPYVAGRSCGNNPARPEGVR